MRKAKKAMYDQKYKEAKEMTQQQINEESFQSGSSDGDEEYYDEDEKADTGMNYAG